MNTTLLLCVVFGMGFIVSLFMYRALFINPRNSRPVPENQVPGQWKADVEKLRAAADNRLSRDDATPEAIAEETGIGLRSVKKLFSRYLGGSVRLYMVRSRLEIAKERLRSSNATEDTIAQSCGFRNSVELRKLFRKYYRIAPAKYRLEQQVG